MLILIFNGKGLIAGIVAVVVFIISVMLDVNIGLSGMLAGLMGLIVSMKLSTKGEGFFALPSIFFIPTHVYSVVLMLLGLAAFWSSPSLFDETVDDYRSELIAKDIAVLDSLDVSGVDSIASELKELMNVMLLEQVKPEEIAYRVLQNEEGDKALILVKFRQIGDFTKEARMEFLELLELYVDVIDFFKDKQVYIGVKNKSSLYITRTPEKVDNSSFGATESDLLAFYADSVRVKP